MKTYLDFLKESAKHTGSIVCFGLDPVIKYFPGHLKDYGIIGFEDYLEYLIGKMIQKDIFPAAFKPNHGFYSIHNNPRALNGSTKHYKGYDVLAKIFNLTQELSVGPVILDFKREDIGPSAANYAKEGFDIWGADAVTVGIYPGDNSVFPFGEYCKQGKGVYVLGKTSNPSSDDIQDQVLENGKTIFEQAVDKVCEWSKRYPGIGIVFGATKPEQLRKCAKQLAEHEVPTLIPGVGGQGGRAEEVIAILKEVGYPLYLARINSSSGMTHPWKKKPELLIENPTTEDYIDISISELKNLNDEVGFIFKN